MSATTKFVVWDWNGTLLDDSNIVLECINIALATVQCAPTSLDVLREIHATPFKALYLDLGVPKEKMDILLRKNNIFHENYERRADHAPLREGAVGLLQRLKKNNVSNVIVSNHIADQIVRMLKRHDIEGFFDKVLAYASCNTQFSGMTKGERVRRHIAAEGLDASNGLIIGDSCEETEIARGLGMSSVAITGGVVSESRLRAVKPDYVIHSLDELNPILQQREFVA